MSIRRARLCLTLLGAVAALLPLPAAAARPGTRLSARVSLLPASSLPPTTYTLAVSRDWVPLSTPETLRFRATATTAGRHSPVVRGIIVLGSERVRTDRAGRAHLPVRVTRRGVLRVRLVVAGRARATAYLAAG